MTIAARCPYPVRLDSHLRTPPTRQNSHPPKWFVQCRVPRQCAGPHENLFLDMMKPTSSRSHIPLIRLSPPQITPILSRAQETSDHYIIFSLTRHWLVNSNRWCYLTASCRMPLCISAQHLAYLSCFIPHCRRIVAVVP